MSTITFRVASSVDMGVLPGAIVFFNGQSTAAGADGTATFDATGLNGGYVAAANSGGVVGTSAQFTLPDAAGTTIAIPVAVASGGGGGNTGTIIITVASQDTLLPIAGALVQGGGVQATTDASGNATLTLPAGSVQVTISAQGFDTFTGQFGITAGVTATGSIGLTPTTGGGGGGGTSGGSLLPLLAAGGAVAAVVLLS